MTALDAPRQAPYKGKGILLPYKLKANAQVYQGGLVVVATATGYAEAGRKAGNLKTVGIAIESAKGGAADGDESVTVRRGIVAQFDNSDGGAAVVQGDVGKTAYLTDDQTVTKTAAGSSAVGEIVALDSDGVWVKID